MTDETLNYNGPARVFHWLIALLILSLLGVGFFMTGMDSDPVKFEIYGLHKAVGITVLLLAFLRLGWRLYSDTPKSISDHKQWEKTLSKTIHFVLYLAIFAMPLSGWAMSAAGGHPVSFFGLFQMPPIVPKIKEIGAFAHEAHAIIAYVIIGCVALHMAGAIKHHVIDKDVTLKRMGGNIIFAFIGAVLLLAAVLFAVGIV